MEIVDYSKLDLSKDELDIIKDIFNENETVKYVLMPSIIVQEYYY